MSLKNKRFSSLSTNYLILYMNAKRKDILQLSLILREISRTFIMAKSVGPITSPDMLAYPTSKVIIKHAKMEDLIRLQNFISHEYLEFYEEIFTWPTTTNNTPDSDFDSKEDIEKQ